MPPDCIKVLIDMTGKTITLPGSLANGQRVNDHHRSTIGTKPQQLRSFHSHGSSVELKPNMMQINCEFPAQPFHDRFQVHYRGAHKRPLGRNFANKPHNLKFNKSRSRRGLRTLIESRIAPIKQWSFNSHLSLHRVFHALLFFIVPGVRLYK